MQPLLHPSWKLGQTLGLRSCWVKVGGGEEGGLLGRREGEEAPSFAPSPFPAGADRVPRHGAGPLEVPAAAPIWSWNWSPSVAGAKPAEGSAQGHSVRLGAAGLQEPLSHGDSEVVRCPLGEPVVWEWGDENQE